MKIMEPSAVHDFYSGVITGTAVKMGTKRLRDIVGAYSEAGEAEDLDRVMYEVYSFENGDPARAGNLNWGLTVMYPELVGEECNFTRGHVHADRSCAEIYFGLAGQGLLLFMDQDGGTWAEKVCRGSLHYIDGRWAHRLVNTGDGVLQVGACWPVTAGHDYQWVEDHPFPVRVFKKNGEIICI